MKNPIKEKILEEFEKNDNDWRNDDQPVCPDCRAKADSKDK